MTVNVRLLPASEQRVVAPIWTDLEERAGDGRVAVSWIWTAAWLRHFGDRVSARYAIVERAGEPIGVALLTLSRRRSHMMAARRLHLGTAGGPSADDVYVEYNDLLCAPGDTAAVVGALAATIRELSGWDELDMPGFRDTTAAELGRALPLAMREDRSWSIRLRPDATVLEGMAGADRRLVRQAQESLEPGEPELAAGPDRGLEILAELQRLHQARWAAVGRPGAFGGHRLGDFLADLVGTWLPDGRLGLYRLPAADGATIGCVVGFVEQRRFLYYQAGAARYQDNRKRAGLLCHTVFAEHCRGRGLREYELLAGDARFKRQLSGGEFNTLVWGRWRRPSLRNSGLDAARRVRDRAVSLRAGARVF